MLTSQELQQAAFLHQLRHEVIRLRLGADGEQGEEVTMTKV